jgi:Do/DeqQ family serine protease
MNSSFRRLFALLVVGIGTYVAVSGLRMWREGKSWAGLFSDSPIHQPEKFTLPEKAPLELGAMDSLSRLNEEYARLTQAVVPSVVSIDTAGVREQLLRDPWGRARMQREMTQGQGSGVIVTEEGHVITNQHVISGQNQIQVTLHDGKSYQATMIGEDRMLDIAVLKIDASGPFTPLKLGDSSQVKVGQIVFAVGNPFGLSETVTQGIISAKERSISDQQRDLFQTDAAINPGNSGGPLVNLQGEIVGINVAIYSPDKTNPGFQGVGFSIPSNDVRESLKQILEKGRPIHGFLGVRVHPIDERLKQSVGFNQNQGTLVVDVVKESPADQAGLQRGDVILEYNHKTVQSPIQLISMVQRTPVGQEIPLKVWRDGQIMSMTTSVVENRSLSQSAEQQSTTTLQLIRQYGMVVRSFTAMEVARGLSGVVVTDVDPQGLASSSVEMNDVIIAVNQRQVRDAEDFYQQFIHSITRQPTTLTLIRNRQAIVVTLPPSEPDPIDDK